MNDTPKTPRCDDPSNAGRKEGERRRDHAHQILEARRARYILLARRAMLTALLRDGTATIDVVREAITLPDGIGPALFGPAIRGLALAGIIHRVRFERTNRPKAHAREVKLWELVDRDTAERWLAEHPPPPDDTGPVAGATEPALDFCI